MEGVLWPPQQKRSFSLAVGMSSLRQQMWPPITTGVACPAEVVAPQEQVSPLAASVASFTS